MDYESETAEVVARELGVDEGRVRGVLELLAGGATVPFIARYRKERTGEMDEQLIRQVAEHASRAEELRARRLAMLESLRERELLTAELESALTGARSLTELEDLYLPFRPKRVTRASRARERGLGPLAEELLQNADVSSLAAAVNYVDPERGVESATDALAGARDIIAERVSEDADSRRSVRRLFERGATIRTRRSRRAADHPAAETFRDYFSWSQSSAKAPSHRILAAFRGEREGVLVMHVTPPERDALDLLRRRWVSGNDDRAQQLELAVEDAYRRLLLPSLEAEQKKSLFSRASEAAADVFAANLRDLLLAPPLGQVRLLAIDPGFRTGCKLVCLDEHGALLHHETIYPLEPRSLQTEASQRITKLVSEYGARAIAVGNGTGGRETVRFLRAIEPAVPQVVQVSEAGASVYSASEAARAEFPDLDVTFRGAVSIGRRLMDPLAELVKIEPQAIGVGQYQHDIDPRLLDERLRQTVESCVNLVGADLNTASPHLLRYISGISDRVAGAVVEHRARAGGFRRRHELNDVPGVGPRTFEQAAGFLRVHGGAEPLDATAVHPERYELVKRIAEDTGCDVAELIGNESRLASIDPAGYAGDEAGLPTLRDLLNELGRPGRDPRPEFTPVSFNEGVHEIDDLSEGMRLPGVVTNVTDFGAFVDVGVHRDGLVHVSKLSAEFVRNPREVVHVGQQVEVTVIEVDQQRKRISLSMIG